MKTADSGMSESAVLCVAELDRSLVVAVIVIVIVVMVIAVVLMIPVTFVNLPALLVVVIVGMSPIRSWVWWTIPAAGDPCVAISAPVPVAIDPGISFAWHWRTSFVPHGWWCLPNIDSNLSKCGNCECCCCDCCCDPFHIHFVVSRS